MRLKCASTSLDRIVEVVSTAILAGDMEYGSGETPEAQVEEFKLHAQALEVQDLNTLLLYGYIVDVIDGDIMDAIDDE